MVKVNGKPVQSEGKTLMEYLLMNGYDSKRIAVEKNGEIVSKNRYEKIILCDGDVIEIVSFVGGG